MICYAGSKRRIAKDILPLILANRSDDQWYVEPFAGGCNSLEHVTGLRIANDSNRYVMRMFMALQRGWVPPEVVTEEEYASIRSCPEMYPPELVGFVGVGCSYGGKWFGGYARSTGKGRVRRNNAAEARRNLLKQRSRLMNVVYMSYDYRFLPIPENSIIYCDPPYANTIGYRQEFDHAEFWNWAREQAQKGHSVFVSEYQAPEDFTCIWEKARVNTLSQRPKANLYVERLFIPSEV